MKWYNLLILMILSTFTGLTSYAQETEIYTERNTHFKAALVHLDSKNYFSAQKEFELAFQETKAHLDNEQKIINNISAYYYAFCAMKLDMPNTELLYLNYLNSEHETEYRKRAYFDLGNYYFSKKKTEDALKWYEKVEKEDLSNEDLMTYKFNMAYTYFTRKLFDESKPLFREIKNGKNAYTEQATYYYGFITFYEKDYIEAQKSFENLKTSSLYSTVVPYYLVQIYFLKNEFQKTIDYASPLLNDPKTKNLEEINHIVGQAYFELGDYTNSIPLLKRYIDKNSKVSKEEMFQLAYAQYKTESYLDAIKNFLPLSVVNDSLGQQAMYLLGNSYLKTNNKPMARDAYLAASSINLNPYINEVSTFQYGKLLYELDDYSLATTVLTNFIANYKNSSYKTEALTLLSNLLLKSKNYAQAIEIIETNDMSGAKIDATYQKLCLYRAVELLNDNQDAEAFKLADKSLKKPLDLDIKAQAIFIKGLVFYNQEKYTDAISAFAWFNQFNIKNNVPWASKKLANYNLAYAHFKLKQYEKATTYFEEALQELSYAKANEKSLVADANLRNADCLLMIKNYDRALGFYDKVIDNNWAAKEYALLQKSVIYGLKGNFTAKISTLETLMKQFPNTHYADQSQFEIADAYLQQNNIESSLKAFDLFIKKYPNSTLMPSAYLKLGLLQSNLGKDDKALEAYKTVVKKYTNTEEAKEALLALKSIYIGMGKPNDYIKFVENEAGLSVSISEQEKILFQSAEEKYMKGDCAQASEILDDYIKAFPKGESAIEAYFFRASCAFKVKNYTSAFKDFKTVAAKGQSKYFEEALVKATYIAYEINKDFEEANILYKDLYMFSNLKSNKEIAQIGLMRTYFKKGNHVEVLRYANEVLNETNTNAEVQYEATFYKAKALFETQKYNQAAVVFKEITDQTASSTIKAESAYHIALIKYKNNDFNASKEDCFFIKNEYASYTYWVVKTFILLSDNYYALDNIFQAKATLQSIINNYSGDQTLINEANEKYNILVEAEKSGSKINLNNKKSEEVEFE